MQDAEKEAINNAFRLLGATINAVVGCAMFADDADRKRDLPDLVGEMRDAELVLEDALSGVGVFR